MLVALLAAAFAGNARAEHVAPIPVPGNPSCADLGFAAGLRIDPPFSGTYTIPGTGHTVTVQTDGTFLDWSSAAGLDAVIAKGSPEGNLYRYEPRSNGDTGLHAPINPVTGLPYALSHVDLCLGPPPPPPGLQLQVSKTAATSYTRAFGWQLTKSVNDDSHNGHAGNSFTSTYTVTATKTVSESAFAVAGQITIHNPTAVGATITGIADSAAGTPAQVSCSLPQDLAAGATLVCPYTLSLGSKANGTNTVTVQTSGLVAGASATADYAFGEPTTVTGDAAVVVTDTDPAGPRAVTVSDSQTFTYAKSFACSTRAADYSGGRSIVNYLNTVTATGPATSLSAAKTVRVDCLQPGQAPELPGDVTVSISPDVVTAPVGSEVLFTVTVTNSGGVAVEGVTTDGTISLVSILSLTPSQGSCSKTTSSFSCSLGTLFGNGGKATIQILARIVSGGNVVAAASATGLSQAKTGASTIVVAIPTALPPPKLGVSVNLIPVSGVVLVNGKPLTAGMSIPVGAKVDTRKGIVNLQSFHGKFRFKNGLFQIRERRVRRGVTELVLLGGNFTRGCGHPSRALSGASSALTHEKKVVRRLWGNGTGSFRTTGKYSSATVRGTIYLTADRCDGTLTQVLRGRVVVADFGLNKNIVLGAGQSYLAKPGSLRR